MEIALTDPHAAERVKAKTALMTVIDPELHINIIDLGLVYSIQFSDTRQIRIEMTLTTPYCPLGEAITSHVQTAMSKAFPECTVRIELVWEPAWGLEHVSEEGKRQLGLED